MPITFPASPSANDTHTVGGRTWTWNGSQWELQATTAGTASINTDELVDGSVTTAKIANANVTTAKIANANVTVAKIDLNAKGDLISASGANTAVRLAVGTNGQALLANSSTSSGLEWGQASSPVDDDSAIIAGRSFG
jgi:hypothetical protein